METVEISPVPGLIKATPATRPSAAWTKWLGKWRDAAPDTRSPYWPLWSRHQSREVLRQAYAQRPSRREAKAEDKTAAEFAQFKARYHVMKFARRYADQHGQDISSSSKADLEGLLVVRLLKEGLDLTRTFGEISVFVNRYSQQWLAQEMLLLTEVLHVTRYGMGKKDVKLASRAGLAAVKGGTSGLNPEGQLLLQDELENMSPRALAKLIRDAKV